MKPSSAFSSGMEYGGISLERLEEEVRKDRVLGKKIAEVERVICQE